MDRAIHRAHRAETEVVSLRGEVARLLAVHRRTSFSGSAVLSPSQVCTAMDCAAIVQTSNSNCLRPACVCHRLQALAVQGQPEGSPGSYARLESLMYSHGSDSAVLSATPSAYSGDELTTSSIARRSTLHTPFPFPSNPPPPTLLLVFISTTDAI